jgi:hypothetical protein
MQAPIADTFQDFMDEGHAEVKAALETMPPDRIQCNVHIVIDTAWSQRGHAAIHAEGVAYIVGVDGLGTGVIVALVSTYRSTPSDPLAVSRGPGGTPGVTSLMLEQVVFKRILLAIKEAGIPVPNIVVDGDVALSREIALVFPSARIVLCQSHALKTLRKHADAIQPLHHTKAAQRHNVPGTARLFHPPTTDADIIGRIVKLNHGSCRSSVSGNTG